MDDLLTVRQLAEEAGVPLSKVLYILMARRIDPARWIARVRLYDRGAVERVRAARREMRKRRRAAAS